MFKRKTLFPVLLSCLLASGPVLADKPDHAGGGSSKHGDKKERKGGHEPERRDNSSRYDRDGGGDRFRQDQRLVIHDYYGSQFKAGKCPPGLAKKHNGCMPPGQAKQWSKGYALSRDVRYYDLPEALIIKLGRPPVDHKYVRVGADILMIAVGSMMVVDAIEDLGGL